MAKITTYDGQQLTEVLAANRGLLLVHFSSSLASSTETLRHSLQEIPADVASFVEVAEVDVPVTDSELIASYGLQQLPTLLLFCEGAIVERLEWTPDPEELAQFLLLCTSYYTVTRSE
ncbi:MAG: thioredoxin domain-containing protein [Planctomycetota bacterium]